MSLGHETIDQVRADKARAARHEDFLTKCIGETDGLNDLRGVGCWDGLRGKELLILDYLSEAGSFDVLLIVVCVAAAIADGCCGPFGGF